MCWRENQPSPPPSTPPPPPMPASLCPALDGDLGMTNILSNVEIYTQVCGVGFDDSTCNGLIECLSKVVGSQAGFGIVTSTGYLCASGCDGAMGSDWRHVCSWRLDNPPGGSTSEQQGLRQMWGSAPGSGYWANVTRYMAADATISRLGDICVGTCASVGASYTVDGVTKTPTCPSPLPSPRRRRRRRRRRHHRSRRHPQRPSLLPRCRRIPLRSSSSLAARSGSRPAAC